MVGVFAQKVVPPEARQRVENDVIEFNRDKAVFDRLSATAQVVNPADAVDLARALDVQRSNAVETVRITGHKPTQ
jgi:hypothetical protein